MTLRVLKKLIKTVNNRKRSPKARFVATVKLFDAFGVPSCVDGLEGKASGRDERTTSRSG